MEELYAAASENALTRYVKCDSTEKEFFNCLISTMEKQYLISKIIYADKLDMYDFNTYYRIAFIGEPITK